MKVMLQKTEETIKEKYRNTDFKPTLNIFKLNVIISWLNLIILLTSRLTFIIPINKLNNYSI